MPVRAAPPHPLDSRLRVCTVVAGLALALCLAAAAHAEELRGRVRLLERGVPSVDVGEALVWWVPDAGAPVAPPRRVSIDTQRRQFVPRTRIVSPGSTVRFPNADPIRHNVFSVSAGNRFDLGLYGQGPGRSQTFQRPGLVRLFCNVHRQMSAWVMVLETPYHAEVEADGSFAMSGLPAGPGVLHVWHPRAAEWTRALVLPAETPAIDLDAVHSAAPDHLDKFGRPYPETPDDGTYR